MECALYGTGQLQYAGMTRPHQFSFCIRTNQMKTFLSGELQEQWDNAFTVPGLVAKQLTVSSECSRLEKKAKQAMDVKELALRGNVLIGNTSCALYGLSERTYFHVNANAATDLYLSDLVDFGCTVIASNANLKDQKKALVQGLLAQFPLMAFSNGRLQIVLSAETEKKNKNFPQMHLKGNAELFARRVPMTIRFDEHTFYGHGIMPTCQIGPFSCIIYRATQYKKILLLLFSLILLQRKKWIALSKGLARWQFLR